MNKGTKTEQTQGSLRQNSKEPALAHTKSTAAMTKQTNQLNPSSQIHTDLSGWSNSKTIEVVNLVSDSTNTIPLKAVTSSNPKGSWTRHSH